MTTRANRLEESLGCLKAEGRKALITYTTAGDPDLETTLTVMEAMADAGADVIELGVPFSDPLADGPVIQDAASRALARGVTVAGIFETVSRYRRGQTRQLPVVLLTYYNPILAYGIDEFASDAAAAGVDGIVVPELPPEEAGALKSSCRAAVPKVCTIFLAAPTSTDERLEVIAASSEGFVYAVSVTGVTGARKGLPAHLPDSLRRIRMHTHLPVAVGFGVESPDDAAALAQLADGVIVGSAIVRRLQNGGPKCVGEYVRELRVAIDEPNSVCGYS